MTIHRTTVICLIALLTFPTGAFGDTFVIVDTTQNGGVFNNTGPTLVISHLTNDPLFTLTNGATTSNVEALIVGNLDGEFGQLLIEDGSSLNNDGSGVIGTYGTETVLGGFAYLGLNAGSSGSATVTGPGSTWTNSGILNIGHSGNGTLSINNGGVVTNGLTYVGSNAGGVGNVTMTGTGSELISASANIVGVYGEGTLDVFDGARVFTPTGYIGLENGSMGTVTVSGSGSTWENAADLNIGLAGTGELNINNGGYVTSQNSDIGLSPNGVGVVNVSGVGSQWENGNSLSVGNEGTGTVNITNGGSVVSKAMDMGLEPGGMGTFSMSGAGSNLSLTTQLTVGVSGTGVLDVQGGDVSSDFTILGFQSGSNGTATFSGAQSSLMTGTELNGGLFVGWDGTGAFDAKSGATIDTSWLVDVGYAQGAMGQVTVQDSGTNWTHDGTVYVGHDGNGTFNVLNGATVSTKYLDVGFGSTGMGEVKIDGFGSSVLAERLFLGNQGHGAMTVSNGGKLDVSSMIQIGKQAGGNGELVVTGANSIVDSVGPYSVYTYVGFESQGSLVIADGGFVESTYGVVGFEVGSHGSVNINGNGANWTINNDLVIGEHGTGTVTVGAGGVLDVGSQNIRVGVSGNGALNIENGGTVVGDVDLLGFNADSYGALRVIGVETSWVSNNLINLGYAGDGLLHVTDGGSFSNLGATIGTEATAEGMAIIDGNGSTWSMSGQLIVAESGVGTLQIENGGAVVGVTSRVGLNANSSGIISVKGNTSTFHLDSFISLGVYGEGALHVEDGGTASHNNAVLGAELTGVGLATVEGSGSNWDLTGGLTVGSSGQGNLRILNGGQVTNNLTIVGRSESAVGAAIVSGQAIDGMSSRWQINETMYVGFDGGEGSLNVGQQAMVNTGRDLFIGYNGTGTANLFDGGRISAGEDVVLGNDAGSEGFLTVNGNGSRIDIGDFFDVGRFGTGTFNIENGGLAVSPGGGINAHYESYIGHFAGSTGVATVTGDGSRWEMSRSLTVGSDGNGTLNILDGGYVTNHFSFIGVNDGSVGSVTVAGEGSLWDSRSYIRMDETSSLTISNHGHVTTPWAADIAYDADSVATVLVTGENSKLTVGGFVVGRFGHGTMTIEDGGYASAVTGTHVGFAGTGITRVTGAGSHLDINSLTVGAESGGKGTLEVLNGGLVTTNSSTSIGHRTGSIGRINVDGIGSTLHVGYDLIIGINGDAQFNITDGGHAIVDNHAWLHANQIDPIATVSGTGSRWSINNWLFIGQNVSTISTVDVLNGGFVSVNGTTRVYNNDVLNIVGGTLRTGSLDVETGGTFNLDGGRLLLDGGVAEGIMFTAINGSMIGGVGTINELTIGADGVLMPGESPGLLHVNVAEFLGDGIYEWEINSVAGQAGESIGWDLVTFETLQLSASENDEFVIQINSLTEMNNNGRLADFDPFSSYTWLIAASDDVDPFDVDRFALDLAEFDNLFFDGNFTLSSGAANYGGFAHGLFLNYTAATVPEPNSLAILLIALALANQRRRRVKTASQKLH